MVFTTQFTGFEFLQRLNNEVCRSADATDVRYVSMK